MDSENTTDLWWRNATNVTTESTPAWRADLALAYRILLPSTLSIIMVAMGCNVSVTEIWQHVRRPFGFAIGAAGQFVLLPLMAFALAHAFSLERDHAIGLLVVATCPGGTVSNIFTYWAKGDISLSISMTTVATLLSFGTMPFNLWLYSRSWTSKQAAIPFLNIFISLAIIMGPVFVGMFIQWRSRKIAKIITSVGSVTGIMCIVMAITMQTILYPQVLISGWPIIVASSVLPFCGFATSYLMAFLCKRTHQVCRTIGLETGFQNAGMAVGIIALSYEGEQSGRIILPSLIYGASVFAYGFIFVGLFLFVSKQQKRLAGNTAAYVSVKQVDKTNAM